MQEKHGHRVTGGLVLLYQAARNIKESLVRTLMEGQADVKGNKVPLSSMIDISYLCDRLEKEANAIKKEARAAKQLVDNIACSAWVTLASMDPEQPKHIEGYLAVGNPNLSATADVPDRKTPQYAELLHWLGATDAQIHADILRPHWPHLMDSITKATEQGMPIPPGIDPASLKTRYALQQLRLKKGVSI